jgi:hypothetical protein
MVDNRTQNKGDGKKVPAPDMPSGGGAYSGGRGSTQCANVRELMGAAPAPSIPGEQISPLLREELNRQNPEHQAGIADVIARKRAQAQS